MSDEQDQKKEHLVKVQIKSLEYEPRNGAGKYRSGSLQVVPASEAYDLDKAGIATIVEDPFLEPTESIPYLDQAQAQTVSSESNSGEEEGSEADKQPEGDGEPNPEGEGEKQPEGEGSQEDESKKE